MTPLQIERQEIARSLGITPCDPCKTVCPFCPKLLALRPDLSWKPLPGTPQPAAYPSIAKKALNFGKAIVEHSVAGFRDTDEETVRARFATCRACDRFDASRTACTVCGCFLDVKIRWAEQKCPLGKW